ncbi:MAG: DinB family protein [Chloroflexi bacterium]|nr:DinB family protein [Chloroflexota bacterium]
MDKKERNEKIEAYGRGYDLLTAALAKVPREAWQFKPSPTDWSVHEIIVHLADSESMSALRARKLIVEPGSTLMGYEEAKWADALHYQKQSADDALQIVKYARQTTYNLLKTLPDEVFTHVVTHAEYKEPYTFEKWLTIYANHIPNHIEQLKKSYQAWKEQKK